MAVLCSAQSLGPTYRPRQAEQTVLYQVLAEHLETFLERVEAGGGGFPSFVTRELRRFLECGIRAHGFMRVRCPECRFEMAVPFSCKGRGFCPSCGGRFMAQTAAHLVDHVLPDVPFRQWVLTLRFALRYRVAFDPRLQSAILRIFVRALQGWQRRRAQKAGIGDPRWGAVTVIQRFGSALQLTPHFHTLGMDGVFALDEEANRARFRSLPAPSDSDVAQLVESVSTRVIASLTRRGLLSGEDDAWVASDWPDDDERAVAACYSAAVQGRLAFGERAGQPLPRLCAGQGAEGREGSGRLQARSRGFDLHAAVAVQAGDRQRLERLCRYITRPPLANDRLEQLADGRIALRLKRPFSDGSTHVAYTPEALIERLCALVPRPRTHRVRYHGLLASASPYRRLVVRGSVRSSSASEATDTAASGPAKPAEVSAQTRFRWVLWAELLRRVFDVNALECPNCSGRMVVLAAIMKADVVKAILESLGLRAEPPAIRPARPPPEPGLVEYDLC